MTIPFRPGTQVQTPDGVGVVAYYNDYQKAEGGFTPRKIIVQFGRGANEYAITNVTEFYADKAAGAGDSNSEPLHPRLQGEDRADALLFQAIPGTTIRPESRPDTNGCQLAFVGLV